MISYTKRNVLVITLVLTVQIYVVISVIWSNFPNGEIATENTQEKEIEHTEEKIEVIETTAPSWFLKIPAINLDAIISEGTTSNVIAKYVGHFKETSSLNGNIGLAAHNRGIGVESYFKNIKELKMGDEIIYGKEGQIKKYKVIKNIIIDETDWSYLQKTNDNRITLITCVENRPAFRRCVQGKEVI